MDPARKRKPIAVDLFAGCGGLTYGLRRAGFFVAAAVEKDRALSDTYRYNNRGTRLLEKDIRELTASDLRSEIPDGILDLLAGCAPCQGFCSLTAKNAREDPRNELLLDMLRFVRVLRPKAIMMENVPGLAARGRRVLDGFLSGIRGLGYVPTCEMVQMADYGVPQSRRRLVVLAGLGFSIPLPKPTHTNGPSSEGGLKPWQTVRAALGRMRGPVKLSVASRTGGPQRANWHVVRDLQPQTRVRLQAARPGETWLKLDEAMRPPCHTNGYIGFTNTYGRMNWDEASPTITAGCTTPCKGRFGHPDRRRTTISVREAAILQTFPPTYQFRTRHIDLACQMIGNAVPPHFAEAVGRRLMATLRPRNGTLASQRKE